MTEINQELERLLELVGQSEVVQEYRRLAKRVKSNVSLATLEEEIKEAQKQATNFAHYGQQQAEQAELKKAQELQEKFDNHPLVVAYRASLIEANDLLQHVTTLIQKEINDALEEEN